MTREKRIEMFILIREKMDEIADIIKTNDAGPEFMSTYCFGLCCNESDDDAPVSYEYLTGYSVDGGDELNVMLNVMVHTYAAQEDNDDDDEPTNSIEYWLKK
jgi:hypothetical protein